jgi:hypothetical protein
MNAPLPIEELAGWIAKAAESPDVTPVLKTWLGEFMEVIADGFEGSHSQFGQQWAPLKRPRPAGHNPEPHPLIDTGALMKSVTNAGGFGQILAMGPDGLTFGTTLPGASAHQDSQRDWLPKRPFLNVNQDQTDRAAELVAQQIILALAP